MADLKQIQRAAKTFSDARTQLAAQVKLCQDAVAKVEAKHFPRIRDLSERCAKRHAVLYKAIVDHRGVFDKPRTQVLHGVRVGLAKSKGRLVVADEDRTVALIRKHLGDRAEDLIKVEEKTIKAALANLSAAELKKIGVEIAGAGDEIVVKPTDSALEKTVEAIIKSHARDAGGGEAA